MDSSASTTLYELALSLHSVLRWAVLLGGAAVFFQALGGMASGSEPGPGGKRLGLVFMICLDLQILLGISLHVFLSPTTKQAMSDMGAAMKDPAMRFWAVEHGATMLLALVVVHVGRVLTRKAADARSIHFRAALFTGIALALLVLRSPWPFGAIERPWIRLPF